MRDLDEGHRMLNNREFKNAYDYFRMMATLYGHETKTLNGCLYGQARALANMGEPNEARKLLRELIEKVPSWEAPYISLARMYELDAQTLTLAGQTVAATECVNEAKKIYESAMAQAKCSQRLKEHYKYFLNDHCAPWENPGKQKTFTPGFQLSQRKITHSSDAAMETPSRVKSLPLRS